MLMESVYFWGQEMEIARHAKTAGRPLDAIGIAATIAAFDLPLLGPATVGYAERVAIAAERLMRDRWLRNAFRSAWHTISSDGDTAVFRFDVLLCQRQRSAFNRRE